MSQPHVQWIDDDDATGQLAEVYRAYKETRPDRPRMPEILKCFSHRPDFLQRVIQFSNEVHFSEGHLDRRTKEMIATLVSALNNCPY